MTKPLLDIQDLVISFHMNGCKTNAVNRFNLQLGKGETIGIVGESGSGKTMSMLAIARLLPPQAFVYSGSVYLDNCDLLALSTQAFQTKISGKRIAMIFQEPMTALNPVYPIGRQLIDALMLHQNLTSSEATRQAIEMLDAVQLPKPKDRLLQYPHELSGGQRQRVMIAIALMNKPDLLIADEPTTALDVTVQNDIIQLLIDLQKRIGMAMIFISHDLGVVSRISQKIMVMRGGEVVDVGHTDQVLTYPNHDYTKALLDCTRKLKTPSKIEAPAHVVPIMQVKNLTKSFRLRSGIFKSSRTIAAVKNISFEVNHGETLAIVGESGSGKSTVARIINGLAPADSGSVRLDGLLIEDISDRARARLMQPIFQDPYSTLNPNQTIGYIVSRPLQIHEPDDFTVIKTKVLDVLSQVGLAPEFYNRFPSQLSGGQRQRVAIARAITLRPRILICDEPTSALDVAIQEQILELLGGLQRDLGMTLIFISHDMAVVRHLANRILVMFKGEIVESGLAKRVLDAPKARYTRKLMNSVYTLPE